MQKLVVNIITLTVLLAAWHMLAPRKAVVVEAWQCCVTGSDCADGRYCCTKPADAEPCYKAPDPESGPDQPNYCRTGCGGGSDGGGFSCDSFPDECEG